jgi:hypothetical protein
MGIVETAPNKRSNMDLKLQYKSEPFKDKNF